MTLPDFWDLPRTADATTEPDGSTVVAVIPHTVGGAPQTIRWDSLKAWLGGSPPGLEYKLAMGFNINSPLRLLHGVGQISENAFIYPRGGGHTTPTLDNWGVQTFPAPSEGQFRMLTHFNNGSTFGHGTSFTLPYGAFDLATTVRVQVTGNISGRTLRAGFWVGQGSGAPRAEIADSEVQSVITPDSPITLTTSLPRVAASRANVGFVYALGIDQPLGADAQVTLLVDALWITRQ